MLSPTFAATRSARPPSWRPPLCVAIRGPFPAARLSLVQEPDGPLGVSGGRHDRPLVALQHLDPARQIGGVILPGLQTQAEIGGEKGAPQLGDQLLPGVALVAEPLTAEISIKARGVTGGVHRFMAPRRVVALRVVEGLQRRELDAVFCG